MSDAVDPMVQIRLSDLLVLRAAAAHAAAGEPRRSAVLLAPAPAAPPPAAEYLTTKAAATLLGVSTKCLEAWRARGEGPRFTQLGRAVRYRLEELRGWAASRDAGAAE